MSPLELHNFAEGTTNIWLGGHHVGHRPHSIINILFWEGVFQKRLLVIHMYRHTHKHNHYKGQPVLAGTPVNN